MSVGTALRPASGELGKLAAFVRRDLMVALSYRTAFAGDVFRLAAEILVFSFVSKLVDERAMPSFGGRPASYMGFVVAGIAVAAFLQLGLGRATNAFREEQLAGTLEPLFATPTSPRTIQLGLVVYDLVYIPVRTALFLLLVTLWTGVSLEFRQLGPALGLMLALAPTIWGAGMMAAGAVLTFRRGASLIGFVAAFATLGSGAYFPLELLPGWAQAVAQWNPIAVALEGVREALLGGEGWRQALPRIAALLPMGTVVLAVGMKAFDAALRRERRVGTLGQY